jgi:hypothetical protein
MNFAPIAVFCFKRRLHLLQTIESLLCNPLAQFSDLFVFSDGPRNDEDEAQVCEVRNYVRSIRGFRAVQIFCREKNVGMAESIIDGVTSVCNQFGRVIVLEDDMIVSPYFLQYMNDALNLYENEDRVISIHGYIYPVNKILPETFFLRGADCWGWATWQRGWKLFNPDGAILLSQLKQRMLTGEFDLDGAYPYTQMLKDQIDAKNDSWAIRWHASAFLQDKLTLYPGRSLVANIGNDGSGTHCGTTNQYDSQLSETPIHLSVMTPLEDHYARSRILNHLKTQQLKSKPASLWRQICSRLRTR